MRKIAPILSMVFFLATSSTIALADVVPGALLYLDARDNPAYPDAWTNLGTAGGELPSGAKTHAAGKTPELERGTVEIPGLGFVLKHARFYTCKEPSQIFGGPAGTSPELPLEDWTFEALCKRNGDALLEEHWMFEFSWGKCQGVIAQVGDVEQGGQLSFSNPASDWSHPNEIDLKLDEWTWIALTGDRSGVVSYQDGEEAGRGKALDFDKAAPVLIINLFASDCMAWRRSFNGSFAIVRIYDKALTADEIRENIRATAAVDPASKLTTTWGMVKISY